MRFKLVPTDDRFFGLFQESAANAAECARRLHDLITDYRDVSGKHDRVVECERQGDAITAQILTRLNSSFVTPFDREDIHALAEELDDVVDDMLAVSDLLKLLPIDEMLPELVEMSEILMQMTEQACGMFERFPSMRGVQAFLDTIDKLESEGDSIYRRSIGRLFKEYEAIDVLMWKDITHAMEGALNTVEDTSNLVESVVLKHA